MNITKSLWLDDFCTNAIFKLWNTSSLSFVTNFGPSESLAWSYNVELRLRRRSPLSSRMRLVASDIWIFIGSEVDSIIWAMFSWNKLCIMWSFSKHRTAYYNKMTLKWISIIFRCTVSPNTEKCGIFTPTTDPINAPECIPILIRSLYFSLCLTWKCNVLFWFSLNQKRFFIPRYWQLSLTCNKYLEWVNLRHEL